MAVIAVMVIAVMVIALMVLIEDELPPDLWGVSS